MRFLKAAFLILCMLASALLSAFAAAFGASAGGLAGSDWGWELIIPIMIGLFSGMTLASSGWVWAKKFHAHYGLVVTGILVVPAAITFVGFWLFYLLWR